MVSKKAIIVSTVLLTAVAIIGLFAYLTFEKPLAGNTESVTVGRAFFEESPSEKN
jgi:hypothetical protein